MTASFDSIEFTVDPIATSLQKNAVESKAARVHRPSSDVKGIYDLTLLNEVLKADGQPRSSASRRPAGPDLGRGQPPTSRPTGSTWSTHHHIKSTATGPVRRRTRRRGRRIPSRLPRRGLQGVRHAANATPALDRVSLDVAARRVRVPARRVRLRQEHAAQPRRRPRPADVRARSTSAPARPR